MYQPKVRLEDGSLYGVEALLRWQHPARGLVNPGLFIPIAEQSGCIVEIGRWVLRSACLQLLDLHRRFPLNPRLELSVNLSPREFKQEGLIGEIAKILEEVGFPPECLHLEITEGVLFEDLRRARCSLLGLKALGVGLDLDDFGSGYSSLRYLQELPFDTLKIDRYFMSSLEADVTGASRMLETIVAMAGHLDMKVVAEGIEKTPQSLLMREMGCDFGQGFLFSRPVRVPELESLLEREIVESGSSCRESNSTAVANNRSRADEVAQVAWA
jgi:EAL domain-containing protein (putative c-di-GMP-specific phosphodiesterase class I)